MSINYKDHWENVYQSKSENQVSWYQKTPLKSIDLINSLNLARESRIIDVGAGESRLVDNLLILGFKNITVLDISSESIEKTKQRLGKKSKLVKWVVSDIVDFIPDESFDLWHDRAAFHFLTKKTRINKYVDLVNNSVNSQGNLIISTFSTNGPLKCSGLQISQYNKNSISELFKEEFKLSYSETSVHQTPFNTNQEFIFNIFSKY